MCCFTLSAKLDPAVAVWGCGCHCHMILYSSSHACSMTFKSGGLDGQKRTWMLCFCRTSHVTRAVCGLSLSCWNTAPGFCIIGTTCVCFTSLIYRWAVKVLYMWTNAIPPVWDIATHITTLPNYPLGCDFSRHFDLGVHTLGVFHHNFAAEIPLSTCVAAVILYESETIEEVL